MELLIMLGAAVVALLVLTSLLWRNMPPDAWEQRARVQLEAQIARQRIAVLTRRTVHAMRQAACDLSKPSGSDFR